MKCAITFFSILVLLMGVASAASAQTSDGYELTWSTLDNGGGMSEGGDYSLVGTIGQADAGSLSGGEYMLNSGFWSGVNFVTANYRVFLPVILR